MTSSTITTRPEDVAQLSERLEFLKRPFLGLSPDPRKNSTIANRFLEPVRQGVIVPRDVVWQVRRTANHNVWNRRSSDFDQWLHWACEEYGWEAFQMAEWAITWNRLSKDERDAVKAQQSRPYVESYYERTTPEQRARQAQKYEKQSAVSRYLRDTYGLDWREAYDQSKEIVARWIETGEVPNL